MSNLNYYQVPKGNIRSRAYKQLRQHQTGLTLIELLVAMAISLFMLIAIALVYSSSKTGFTYANNTVRMSEDAAFVLELMGRDIRMAGYAGCAGSAVGSTGGATPADVFIPSLDLVDAQTLSSVSIKPNPFSGVSGGNLTAIFTARNAVWGFPANDSNALSVLGGGTTSYTLSTTNPILYLAGGSPQALQLSASATTVDDNLSITANTYGWSADATSPTFLIISNCQASELFRGSLSGGGTVINHSTTSNDSASFANVYSSDATITALHSSVYFIATRVGSANPSLYRRFFNGRVATTEELVPNVEAITFHYGENTSNTTSAIPEPTYRADIYRTDPAAVVDWSRVVSVRMGLILVSEENGQASVANQSVAWINGTYTPPNDRRVRRAYSTTVSVRNRMGL
jgi:type IV pilus assembly protein PilW